MKIIPTRFHTYVCGMTFRIVCHLHRPQVSRILYISRRQARLETLQHLCTSLSGIILECKNSFSRIRGTEIAYFTHRDDMHTHIHILITHRTHSTGNQRTSLKHSTHFLKSCRKIYELLMIQCMSVQIFHKEP